MDEIANIHSKGEVLIIDNVDDFDNTNAENVSWTPEILEINIDEDCDFADTSTVYELDGEKLSIYPNPIKEFVFIPKEIRITFRIR